MFCIRFIRWLGAACTLGAVLSSVATSVRAEMPDPALEPPVLITSPGAKYSDTARDYAMTIGIERTRGGRLWAAWVAGGDSELGYFVLASSDDEGATWSPPRLVIDPDEPPQGVQRRILVGNLWTDPTGRLWLFFDQSLGYFDGRAGAWAITCDEPDASEPRWSAPRRIWHGCTLNKPTVLSDGTWLMPISLWQRSRIRPTSERRVQTTDPAAIPTDFTARYAELDSERRAHLFASSDQGTTWTRRGGVVFPQFDFDEHMTVELRDGRLWMLARTLDGIAESFSSDQGHTWSEPQIRFAHINARFHLRRLQSGQLLLVKHGAIDERTPKRSHLRAFISNDDGVTWNGGLLLDDRTGISYPDGFQAPDGRIYISYDRERAKEREILMAVFTVEDVAAGQWRSPQGRQRVLINKATGGMAAQSSTAVGVQDWSQQAALDAQHDRTSIAYDGVSPNKMVCDTTLRQFNDGSWVLYILAGGDREPSPLNYIGVTRSQDQGRHWTPLEAVHIGLPRTGNTIGQGATELLIRQGRCTMFLGTHARHWSDQWHAWFIVSDDNGRSWSQPMHLPGRLQHRTFIRSSIVARDGRILLPFQHYVGPEADAAKAPLDRAFTNPRNGVLISHDDGRTWSEHGNVRLTDKDRYFGWAEPTIVEQRDGRIVMLIRGDKLGGVLWKAESHDGGRTWPEFASRTEIPNPGSKATLYSLGGDTVALLHNPNPHHRSPLALWISFDGLRSWPYRRVLVAESCDGPQGRLNYPDGFVSADREWLHFAFDDNRHRAVHYSAKLPPLPRP